MSGHPNPDHLYNIHIRGIRYSTRPMGPVSVCATLVMLVYLFCHSEGQGFILVYSIASRATFERLEVFRQSMLRVKRTRPIFMLVGNKCDKTYEREVSREEGMELARTFGCDFLETSAKTAVNVERLFTNLVRMLRSSRPDGPQPGPAQAPVRRRQKNRCIIL